MNVFEKVSFISNNINYADETIAYLLETLKDGFIILKDDNTDRNASDQEYQYLAWAQFPFVASNDTPGTAR